jgi:16S rRNA (cytosine967-C5)-methyltransferase
VVDQAVSAIKFLGQGAAKGLVNAILRNFLRQRESLLKQVSKDSLASLNHPEWWVKKIKSQYPIRWLPMLEAVNHLPPMTLRVNKRRISPDAYLELLKTHDIEATLLGKEAIVLSRAMPVDKLPGFFDGLSSVQDQSAQYSAALLDASAGMSVLDACSAPGGKAGHLLECADIDLTAMDADEERLSRVSDNLQRLGLTAKLLKADAGDVESWWDGKQFDRILLDVPCSGSGVTKRHPDIKWIRRPSDIQQFAEQQKRLLNNLWPTLRVGGKLLYVTCSVFREENEDQISAHLTRFNDARRLDINESTMVNGQIIPDEFHDGFFYALLEKV